MRAESERNSDRPWISQQPSQEPRHWSNASVREREKGKKKKRKKGNSGTWSTWINFEDIMLSEVWQSQKDEYCMIAVVWVHILAQMGKLSVKYTTEIKRMTMRNGHTHPQKGWFHRLHCWKNKVKNSEDLGLDSINTSHKLKNLYLNLQDVESQAGKLFASTHGIVQNVLHVPGHTKSTCTPKPGHVFKTLSSLPLGTRASCLWRSEGGTIQKGLRMPLSLVVEWNSKQN